jgi:hypothetical protein
MVATVKLLNGDDVPFGDVTVRVCKPAGALAAIVSVTGTAVDVPPGRIAAVTPLPLKAADVSPFRFDPLMTADTVCPAFPALG